MYIIIFIMIVLISDAYSVSKIKECSDFYSTVFRCGRCAVGGVRIVKVINGHLRSRKAKTRGTEYLQVIS